MNIKIRVFKGPGAEPECREIKAGTTIEELLYEYRSHLPYRIYTAKINSVNVGLTQKIESECDLTFCDIRDDVAIRSFQRGLTLLLLKAVNDIYGSKVKVMVRSSVNRGIFTMITHVDTEEEKQIHSDDSGKVSGEKTWTSEERRKKKTPKKESLAPRKSALSKDELRQIEKRMWKLVDANKPIKAVGGDMFKLEDFSCLFYGLMPPSTGSLFPFALEPMRGGVMLRYPHPSDPHKLAFYKRDARVFNAYDDEQAFLDRLEIGTISDLNKQIRSGSVRETVSIAEASHLAHIQDIVQMILDSKKRVVLLAGPSSSGKTTTAKRLIDALTLRSEIPPLYFGTDDYYVERVNAPKDAKGEYNYEGLDAIDVELFAKNIKELLSGKIANLPKYDFVEGKKSFGERKVHLKENQLIIVEGIHALNKKFSASIDDGDKFRLYISPLTQLNIDNNNRVPSTEVRLFRRMIRDHRTRGKSAPETILTWPKVRAGEIVNIFPGNHEADAVFNSTLVYELAVLKKYAEPLLEEISADDPVYGTAKRLLEFLSFFDAIEDESPIPVDSVLREFIGGSCYEP